MGGLGISSVPHLTITSPLVNRLCSSRWNYRRCQSPHKGCHLTLDSKLIIREDPGSHPSRLIQSLQQATPQFRCSLCSQFNTYMIPSLLSSNLGPQLGSTTLHFFPTKPPECVTACWCMRNVNCRLWPYWSAFNQSPHPQCRVKTLGIWLALGFEPRTSLTKA